MTVMKSDSSPLILKLAFYASFLAAELPSQLSELPSGRWRRQIDFLCVVSKKLGSDTWIPIQVSRTMQIPTRVTHVATFKMMAWSLVAISQVGLKNVHGFYATRALLGLLEGYVKSTIIQNVC